MTIDKIHQEICNYFLLDSGVVKTTKDHETAYIRHLIMYIAKIKFNIKYRSLAAFYGQSIANAQLAVKDSIPSKIKKHEGIKKEIDLIIELFGS